MGEREREREREAGMHAGRQRQEQWRRQMHKMNGVRLDVHI